MKVAHVCPRYYPDIGGVETYVQEISERMVKRGFDVEVICTDSGSEFPEHEIKNGVKITRFKTISPGYAYYFSPQIYFYLRNHRYDLIHAHSYHALPALFAALAKKKWMFVFSAYYHGGGHTNIRNFLHKPYKLIGRNIFKKSDKVICISEYERRKIISDFGVPSTKIEKIPIGLKLEEFVNLKRLKIHKNKKTLLYVGRLEEYKGVQYIIKILPLLPDFNLDVVGKGPYENDLKKLAEKLSVTEQIKWHKDLTREELLQQYASADIFFMLSTHESYGITVAEALAAGTPCIVAIGSALDEFVDGKRCIGINTPISPDKLIKSVEQLKNVCNNKVERKNLSFQDWNDVTDKVIEVYRGMR